MPGPPFYQNIKFVEENRHGKPVAINRNGSIVIQDREGRERERYTVVYGAVLEVQDGEAVASGQKLAEWDPTPTLSSPTCRAPSASTTSSPASP